MKKVLKIIGIIFGVIYVFIAVTLTILLLKYNKYNLTEINGNTFILVRDDELKPDFKKGDLVIVNRNNNKDINVGDKIFFYDIYKGKVSVNLATIVNKKDVNRKEADYTVDGDYVVFDENVIGKASTSKTYAKLGTVLSILESRVMFLLAIIFPILAFFIYEVYVFIEELKSTKEDE
mgnify:CR=1 FL=1